MNVGIERRLRKRDKAALEVRCESFGLDEIFVSRDVSTGGLFLNTPDPLVPGSQVELSFSVTPEGPEIECPGRVVYALPGVGMGIQFIDARGEVEMALSRPFGGRN
jgi:PilZ domain